MPRGGRRVGAGRPRKAVVASQKASAPPEQQLPPSPPITTQDPLAYMLAVMNDPAADAKRRDYMAVAAAPYVHRKQGEGGKKDEKKAAASRVAGKFAPAPSPPRLVVDNSR